MKIVIDQTCKVLGGDTLRDGGSALIELDAGLICYRVRVMRSIGERGTSN